MPPLVCAYVGTVVGSKSSGPPAGNAPSTGNESITTGLLRKPVPVLVKTSVQSTNSPAGLVLDAGVLTTSTLKVPASKVMVAFALAVAVVKASLKEYVVTVFTTEPGKSIARPLSR